MFAERKRNETERNGTETETAGLRRTQIVAKRNVTKRNGSERAIPIKTERKNLLYSMSISSLGFRFIFNTLALHFPSFGFSFVSVFFFSRLFVSFFLSCLEVYPWLEVKLKPKRFLCYSMQINFEFACRLFCRFSFAFCALFICIN